MGSTNNLSLCDNKELIYKNVLCETLPDDSVSFSHQINYIIPSESYAQWPKFKSILIDKNSKQIVSFRFHYHNKPNFDKILNVCDFFKVSCSYRDIATITKESIIRITGDSIIDSIAMFSYLSNVYSRFSPEAAQVIDQSLVFLAEDLLHSTDPTWEQDIGIKIREINNLMQNNNNNVLISANYSEISPVYGAPKEMTPFYDLPSEHSMVISRSFLSKDEERIEFNKAKLKYIEDNVKEYKNTFTLNAIKDLEYFKKFEKIENYFSTNEKCCEYLYKKNATVQFYVEEAKSELTKQLNNLFQPTAIETIRDTVFSDKILKNAKSGNTLVGSGTDLVVTAIQLGKDVPILNTLFTALNGLKVVVSSVDLLKRNVPDFIHKESFQANFTTLASSFICKATICSLEVVSQLTDASRKILTEFHTKFIRDSIVKDQPHQFPSETYLASNLLDKLSNYSYVERIGTKKDQYLEFQDGTSIQIADYIKNYNQTLCYENVLNDLMGQHGAEQIFS